MHLTYDLLDGYAALVLVDATPGGAVPGEVTVLEVGPEDLGQGEFDAHGMQQVAVDTVTALVRRLASAESHPLVERVETRRS